jgi:glycosyltransferase involved in cell wall biosynthesis
MARGQVVVAARSSSLPEAGGDAAIYVDDPNDPASLAAALEIAIAGGPEHAALVRKGKAHAKRFTWDRCAAGVVAVIRELIA